MPEREPVSVVIEVDGHTLNLAPPSDAEVDAVGVWPMGIRKTSHEGHTRWLIILENANGEAKCLKYHFGIYHDKHKAQQTLSVLRLLLPANLLAYQEWISSDFLLPCAYLRETEEGDFEVGYALFISSESDHPKAPIKKPVEKWERDFGEGASEMIYAYLKASEEVWLAHNLPERKIADLKMATRSDCGGIALDFLSASSHLCCLKESVAEDDPLLQQAARLGIERLAWLPSLPTTLTSGE